MLGWFQGRGNEKTFAEENLDHAPEDLSANLKNVVDDLAGKCGMIWWYVRTMTHSTCFV